MINVASGVSVAPEETTTHTRGTPPIMRCFFERLSYPPPREGERSTLEENQDESVAFFGTILLSPKRENMRTRTRDGLAFVEDGERRSTKWNKREQNARVSTRWFRFPLPQGREFHVRTDRPLVPLPPTVRRGGFDQVNDPSAGSPTETLLRLLLPLDGRVQ